MALQMLLKCLWLDITCCNKLGSFLSDSLVADIHKKITDAFDLFDHESNKTVDVR